MELQCALCMNSKIYCRPQYFALNFMRNMDAGIYNTCHFRIYDDHCLLVIFQQNSLFGQDSLLNLILDYATVQLIHTFNPHTCTCTCTSHKKTRRSDNK